MAEKMLNSFDIQDSIADDDIVLGYDKSENKVKNFKFGTGIWNWLVDKMANAVVSKLTTADKTVLGAINELNSNSSQIYRKDNVSNIAKLVKEVPYQGICIFHLNGAGYSGSDLPKGTYNYGSGIIFNRNTGSCKIVLFSESDKPIWKLSDWQKWRDFTNSIIN